MQISIQAQKITLTDAMRGRAIRRLRSNLICCDVHIQRIIMRLSDVNGPRGGVDKCCRIQVVLKGMPDVVIEDVEAELNVAIDRASERAGRTVVRKVDRYKTLLRNAPFVSDDSHLQYTEKNTVNSFIN